MLCAMMRHGVNKPLQVCIRATVGLRPSASTSAHAQRRFDSIAPSDAEGERSGPVAEPDVVEWLQGAPEARLELGDSAERIRRSDCRA